MQKAWGVVSLILTLCALLYLVLWLNLSERFYSKTIIISALILSPHGNISLYKTEKPFHPTERELNITPIPVLYKKNFTKLPVWDFEDVYLRDSQPRKPTCPKSFQTTEDHEFKEAVLPDIQLWLYKGHLNITEWNRLAHFNNPFGFMEYNYNGRGNSHDHLKWDLVLHFFLFENPFQADISCKGRKGSQFPFHVDFKKKVKRAVDLIPKPKSSILLPVPEGAKDGCIRCAVVGCGGILNDSKMGKEIDSHDYVFRVNGAVTQGYEEDVGKRTSVYVHTAFSLYSNIHSLKKYGFNNIPQDEGIKYVMIPEGMRDFDWLQGLLQGKVANGSYKGVSPLKFFNGHFNESRFYVLHPDFLRYVRNRFMPSKQLQGIHWALFRPTNGAFALFLAMHTCDIVDAYGYITEDHHKYSNYYYEKLKKTRVIFYINHDYSLEIKTWKKLHDSGIIRLFQRH